MPLSIWLVFNVENIEWFLNAKYLTEIEELMQSRLIEMIEVPIDTEYLIELYWNTIALKCYKIVHLCFEQY